jgi:hypothetical protein
MPWLLTSSCRELKINPEDQLDQDARVALRSGFWEEIEANVLQQGRAHLSES